MNIYVNADTGTSGGDGSAESPVDTIQGGLDLAGPGDVVLVAGGTYNEGVTVTTSGAGRSTTYQDILDLVEERYACDFIVVRKNPSTTGDVELAGDGFRAAITLQSVHHLVFRDLRISNNEGEGALGVEVVAGVEITGNTPTGAGAIGSYEVHFVGCSFTGIVRNSGDGSYGLPLSIYSQGDVDSGGTATHHITCSGCSFYGNTLYDEDNELQHADITVTGNVHDVLVRQCHFQSTVLKNMSALETGSLPTANPQRASKIVFEECRFKDYIKAAGAPSGLQGTGLYFHGCQNALALRCRFANVDVAVEVAEETAQYSDGETCLHTLAKDCVFKDCFVGWAAGAWTIDYTDVADAAVVGCAFWNSVGTAEGSGSIMLINEGSGVGVLGDLLVANNVVVNPDQCMNSTMDAGRGRLDRNYWVSDAANPFRWLDVACDWPYSNEADLNGNFGDDTAEVVFVDDTDDTDNIPGGFVAISDNLPEPAEDVMPLWYVRGVFGDYEPESI